MTLALIGHVTKIYSFISTSIWPVTTKPGRMIDQDTLIVASHDNNATTCR